MLIKTIFSYTMRCLTDLFKSGSNFLRTAYISFFNALSARPAWQSLCACVLIYICAAFVMMPGIVVFIYSSVIADLSTGLLVLTSGNVYQVIQDSAAIFVKDWHELYVQYTKAGLSPYWVGRGMWVYVWYNSAPVILLVVLMVIHNVVSNTIRSFALRVTHKQNEKWVRFSITQLLVDCIILVSLLISTGTGGTGYYGILFLWLLFSLARAWGFKNLWQYIKNHPRREAIVFFWIGISIKILLYLWPEILMVGPLRFAWHSLILEMKLFFGQMAADIVDQLYYALIWPLVDAVSQVNHAFWESGPAPETPRSKGCRLQFEKQWQDAKTPHEKNQAIIDGAKCIRSREEVKTAIRFNVGRVGVEVSQTRTTTR
jgi:hypothetical protein